MIREYQRRINNTLQFIHENLDQNLNLSTLSSVANYSPFHFHRLFKAITGESPNKYVLRLRIERSAYQMKKSNLLSLSEIAFSNGFQSSANFSKSFKKYYGITPSELKANSDQFSKIRQVNSKNGQTKVEITDDLYAVINSNKIIPLSPIFIQRISPITVAYTNYIGAFNDIGSAYAKVMKWAKVNGIHPLKRITRFYDSPEVTDLSQIRQNACVVIDKKYEPSETISFSVIEEGKYATGKFEIEMQELDKAWQTMMLWVAEQELIPDPKRTCFEKYHAIEDSTLTKITIELYAPVKTFS